jgi:hypothetical protein
MEFGTLHLGPLPPNTSTQLADLVALTKIRELIFIQTPNMPSLSSMLTQPFGRKEGC